MSKILVLSCIAISILLSMTSCEKNIDFRDIIQSDEAFQLTILIKDDRTMLGEKNTISIEPGSLKHQRLINWLNQHPSGWKKTIAVYEPRSVVSQKDFKLNYMGYFISVNYIDKSGSSHHYSKTIDVESLGFLFD